jgi:hypothetical protein
VQADAIKTDMPACAMDVCVASIASHVYPIGLEELLLAHLISRPSHRYVHKIVRINRVRPTSNEFVSSAATKSSRKDPNPRRPAPDTVVQIGAKGPAYGIRQKLQFAELPLRVVASEASGQAQLLRNTMDRSSELVTKSCAT